jgi:hypothetical protein
MSYLPDSYKVRSGPGVSGLVQPPAKKTAGLIEKETQFSYDLNGIRLRAKAVCMQFNLILFVLVLVLVLEIRIL